VIVVVGNPFGRRAPGGLSAAGLPVAVARAAAESGVTVQLIGKVGDGPDGDAVVLAVAEAGVGHAALLRGPIPVPVEADDDAELDRPLDEVVDASDDDGPVPQDQAGTTPTASLEAADLALGLRYLPDYRVVVIAQPLADDALAAAVDAARWAEARLVVVTAPGQELPGMPPDATVLEAPDEDAEGAFAIMVGRYAAAMDGGAEPADAFATASDAAGWSAVAAD
jgi:hypothetical protein